MVKNRLSLVTGRLFIRVLPRLLYMYPKRIITTITDQIDGKKAIFYQVNLELINVESNEKAWIGNTEIKKSIKSKKIKG